MHAGEREDRDAIEPPAQAPEGPVYPWAVRQERCIAWPGDVVNTVDACPGLAHRRPCPRGKRGIGTSDPGKSSPAAEPRVILTGFRVRGSASGTADSADRWSDLDVMITATDPVAAAQDLGRQISRLSPVFAASRSGNASSYCVRLVLQDLRRIDITASAPAAGQQDLASAVTSQNPADAVAELIGTFRFEAVLAAVKAARGDILIGAHRTPQLARHILVIHAFLHHHAERDRGSLESAAATGQHPAVRTPGRC